MKRNWILAATVAVAVTFGGMAQTTPTQTTPSQTTPTQTMPASGNKKDKKMKKDSTGTHGAHKPSSGTQKKDTVNPK